MATMRAQLKKVCENIGKGLAQQANPVPVDLALSG